MASNIATKRLIDRLQPSVGAVEIADDIWVCPADQVSEVRAVLADQPHFLYFLDRGIKADEFSMNGDGQKFWVLRNPSWTAGPENPVLFDLAYSESAPLKAYNAYDQMVTRQQVKGFDRVVYTTTLYEKKAGLHPDGSGGYDGGTVQGYPASANIFQNRVGSLFIGRTAIIPSHTYAGSIQYDPDAPKEPTQSYRKIGIESTESSEDIANWVSDVNQTVRKNYVMISGPSGIDYGEVLPEFTWFVARAEQVGERIKVALDFAKAKNKNVNQKQLDDAFKAVQEMIAAKSFIVSFKGSVAVDPVKLWPVARGAFGSFSGVIPDGEVITAATLEEGKRQWTVGGWCISAIDVGNSDAELFIGASSLKALVLKPSGLESAHVKDGDGTVEMGFEAIRKLAVAVKRAGGSVTFEPSPFESQSGFDKASWDRIKAETAATVADAPAGTTGPPEAEMPAGANAADLAETLPESICVRLLTEPMFTQEDEALVLPVMSPQSMFTDYARNPKTKTAKGPGASLTPTGQSEGVDSIA